MHMVLYEGETGQKQAAPANTGSFNFDKLPTEVQFEIVSYLPSADQAFVVPFVSEKLFHIVKQGTKNWSVLDFSVAFPSRRELDAICNLATNTCEHLLPMDGLVEKPYEPERMLLFHEPELPDDTVDLPADAPSLLKRLFLRYRWDKVKTITWEGSAKGFDQSWLKGGLLRPNFPNLTVLVLKLELVSIGWDLFHGCKFEQLERLEVAINTFMDEEKARNIRAAFPKLKELEVHVEWTFGTLPHVFPVRVPAMMRRDMPKLESLSVYGLYYVRAGTEPFESGLAYFEGAPVNHVRLSGFRADNREEKCDELAQYYRQNPRVVPGNWLLTEFPKLSFLEMGPALSVDWDNSQEAGLLRITDFRSEIGRSVPFDKMQNLETCLISSSKSPLKHPECVGLLLSLPNLNHLTLLGKSSLDALAARVTPENSRPAVEYLDVSLEEGLDTLTLGTLEKVLPCFPNLLCLRFDVGFVNAFVAEITRVLKDTTKKLEHFELVVRNYDASRQRVVRSLEQLKELLHHLPFRSEIYGPFDDADRVFFSTGATELPDDHQECFIGHFCS